MLAEDVDVQFAGFEPNSDARSSIYFLLNRMHLISPSKSFLSATFTMTNGIFEGAIKITSNVGNFVADAKEAKLTDLTADLFEKIGVELANWKSLRFK